MISTAGGTYHLGLPLSVASVQYWFDTSLIKPARPHSSGLSALEDDCYKLKAILQINKHEAYAKVKWMGYDSSQSQ